MSEFPEKLAKEAYSWTHLDVDGESEILVNSQ